jgi:hypothetical protein
MWVTISHAVIAPAEVEVPAAAPVAEVPEPATEPDSPQAVDYSNYPFDVLLLIVGSLFD